MIKREKKTKPALWLSAFPPKASPVPEKPKRIKARTAKRANQEAIYRREVKKWLLLPENRYCRVSQVVHKYDICSATDGLQPFRLATQCHHKRGRRGPLLNDKRFWIPVSMWGHRWIEEHPEAARQFDLLCEKGQWNNPA